MTQTVLLGDIAAEGRSIISGPFGSSISSKFFVDAGVPVIRGNNLSTTSTDRFTDNGFVYISREKADELKAYAHKDDIILTAAGTLGQVGIIPSAGKFEEYVISNKQIRVTVDKEKVRPLFVYYALSTPAARSLIESMNTGSTIPLINLGIVKRLPIPKFDLETQDKIIDIIGTIDEKIELNRKMNETLEQMGQVLFRHYFIDNPEAEKWSKRELGEFFPIKTGKKDANFGKEDGEFPFFTCAQTISKAPNYSFDAHALLLAGNGDFNLKLYRGKFEAYQRTYVLVPNDERLVGLLYFLMKMKLSEITGGSRGSVIKFITKGMIENYKFTLPNDERLIEMAEVFNQLTVNIEENVKQIQTLTTLRDTLLPRLVNGRVKL